MKANKALKRLAKIETSVSDLAKRFIPSAHIREVLQDAKAAVIRAKEAVLEASTGATKKKQRLRRQADQLRNPHQR